MEREINFLSADELDAVVGGMMNTGGQQLINKDQRGVPGSLGTKIAETSAVVGAVIIIGGLVADFI
jgi:hypothetical protein